MMTCIFLNAPTPFKNFTQILFKMLSLEKTEHEEFRRICFFLEKLQGAKER